MKLKSKLTAITAAATLAFVGVGFAAWTFNKDAEVASQATVFVTTEAENGTLTVTSPAAGLYIVLDQAEIYYASDAAGENEITAIEANYNTTTDGTLGENMDVDFELSFSGATADWGNYVSGLGSVDLGTKTVVNGDNALSFTLPSLSYVEANKPSTESEYDAMKAALNGKQMTITITADAAADDVSD